LVASASPERVTLPAPRLSKTLTLAETLRATLTTPGRHTVEVQAFEPDGAVALGAACLNLLPGLHLVVTNESQPDAVPPLETGRVRTRIRVLATAETGGGDLPVRIGETSVTPTGDLADQPGVQATVSATDITNAGGQPVADGTRLAVYVPYGRLLDGEPAPGSPGNPQIRVLNTVAAGVTCRYEPVGGTLQAGQFSVTAVEFHQFIEGAEPWFGAVIGSVEVRLRGP
jgi:hypothetical protein